MYKSAAIWSSLTRRWVISFSFDSDGCPGVCLGLLDTIRASRTWYACITWYLGRNASLGYQLSNLNGTPTYGDRIYYTRFHGPQFEVDTDTDIGLEGSLGRAWNSRSGVCVSSRELSHHWRWLQERKTYLSVFSTFVISSNLLTRILSFFWSTSNKSATRCFCFNFCSNFSSSDSL